MRKMLGALIVAALVGLGGCSGEGGTGAKDGGGAGDRGGGQAPGPRPHDSNSGGKITPNTADAGGRGGAGK